VPSFEMGAEGAEVPLDWGSSFPLDSRVSFRLRIFLIETANPVHVSRGGGASQEAGSRGRIPICLSRSEVPRAAMVDGYNRGCSGRVRGSRLGGSVSA